MVKSEFLNFQFGCNDSTGLNGGSTQCDPAHCCEGPHPVGSSTVWISA